MQVVGERQDLGGHMSVLAETWCLPIGQSVVEDG